MTEVIGVKFKDGGKVYYFDPIGISIFEKQEVIVDTSRGIEFGICAEANKEVEDNAIVAPLRPLVRIATNEDKKRLADNKEKGKKAFDICVQKISAHSLDMKLIDVEYNFDGSKILFFFTSDGRVDFRELVKSLATIFKTRIELRQIGVRDEAKLLGGLGICGKPFCCSTFLEDFQPVSIKMAKTQNLSLNPAKISGTCGRLMCCLKYEQDAYESLIKETPKVDTPVLTPDGPGKVTEVSLMRGVLKVRLSGSSELVTLHSYKTDEISPLDAEGNPIRPVTKRLARPAVSYTEKIPTVSYNSDKILPGISGAGAPDTESPVRERLPHGNKKNRFGRDDKREPKTAPIPAPIPALTPAPEAAAHKDGEGQARKRKHRRPGKKPADGQTAQQPKPPAQSQAPHKSAEQSQPHKDSGQNGQTPPKKNNSFYKKRHYPGNKRPEGSGGGTQ